MTVYSRKACLALGATMAYLSTKLAADAKFDLAPIFDGVDSKNFGSMKSGIANAIQSGAAPMLAADAKLDDLPALLDAIDGEVIAEDAEVPHMKPVKPAYDGKLRGFLKGKLAADDMKAVEEMMGKDSDEDDEEGMSEDEKKKRKLAKDKEPKDKDMITKPAMDEAIASAVKTATESERKNQRDMREAEKAVRPYVGDLAVAFDSAEGVYRSALKSLGVSGAETIHASALPALLSAQPVPGSGRKNPEVAMDAAGAKSFADRYPDAAAITSH